MRFRKFLVKGFIFLFACFILFLVICSVYGAYATHRDAVSVPPLGNVIPVNGHRMHLNCMGRGSTTVILESALAGPTVLWEPMASRIAEFARVCSYDRDGVGWSEESGQPRTVAKITNDLHALLSASGEKPPFLFVGHSIGGMLALDYARRFPSDVSAMVLLDPTHPQQFDPGTEQWKDHQQALKLFKAGPTLARMGLLRFAFWLTDKLKPLPVSRQVRDQYIAVASTPKAANAMKLEAESLFQLCADSKDLPNLGDRPLIVLTASRTLDEGFPPNFHEEMAKLSTRGIHRIVPDATHSGIVLKPKSMEVSIEAVHEVVNSLQ